jgi:RNA polymerase sigma-70 factor (ECF subfamily)
MQYSAANSLELLQFIKNDDKQAFNELYHRFWEPLYLIAFRKMKDQEEAKDVVQHVFANLWLYRHGMTLPDSPEAYLFGSLRNEILRSISRMLRDRQRQEEIARNILPEFEQLIDPLYKKELLQLLDKQVELLPDRMQQVYRMSREQHLSVQEIAGQLGLSEQTVRNQLNTALKKIRVGLREVMLLAIFLKNIS